MTKVATPAVVNSTMNAAEDQAISEDVTRYYEVTSFYKHASLAYPVRLQTQSFRDLSSLSIPIIQWNLPDPSPV